MDCGELKHWGVKGMKWGVRRYQNKDGSLTPAGRKRYADSGSSTNKASNTGKPKSSSTAAKSSKESESLTKKKISEMTDDELRTKLNRINMELQYRDAVARLTPDRTKRAKKIVADLAEQAVRNLASKAIEKGINSLMGNSKPADTRTAWENLDLSKIGDKQLQSALRRASSESALRRLIKEKDK